MSPEQRAEFERSGVLRLPGAVRPAVAAEMCERIWDEISQRGIKPDERQGQIFPSKTKNATKSQTFNEFWGETVRAAIDSILGAGRWQVPAHSGQLLAISFPASGPDTEATRRRWVLPSKVWHLDYQAPGGLRGLPGVQIFVCLDRVEPRGGATLAIAGSHHLVDRVRLAAGPGFDGRSADVRKAIQKQVPWYHELCSVRDGEDRIARFMDRATDCDGVELRVVEFFGERGDVVLMHPWIIHAPAANCGTRPRLVISERLRTQSPAPAAIDASVDEASAEQRGGAF